MTQFVNVEIPSASKPDAPAHANGCGFDKHPARAIRPLSRTDLVTVAALIATLLLGACASSSQTVQPPQPPQPPSASPPSSPSSTPPSPPSQSSSRSPSPPSSRPPSSSPPSAPSPSSSPSSPSSAQAGKPPSSPAGSPSESAGEAGTSGSSELEVLEPEESEVADSDAEPTWEEEAESGGESGGEESLAESSDSAAAGSAGASGGESAEGSEAEQMASATGGRPGGGSPIGTEESLDAELNSSLEIFEGEMERTITVLASGDPADGESSGPAGGAGGAEEEGGPFDQTGQGAELVLVNGDPSLLPGSQDSDGQTGDVPVGGRPGLEGGVAANDATPRVPGDVGDGQDDDVVARQIREAAVNEDDPGLREKLWEEYRNYKRSIQ